MCRRWKRISSSKTKLKKLALKRIEKKTQTLQVVLLHQNIDSKNRNETHTHTNELKLKK
jgi:hypothetical protein